MSRRVGAPRCGSGRRAARGDVLLQEHAVEPPRRIEAQRHARTAHRVVRGPIGVVLVVEQLRGGEAAAAAPHVRSLGRRPRGEVLGEDAVERRTEFAQTQRIDRGDAPPLVGRDVEQQQRIAPHAGVVDLEQLGERLDLRILRLAVEPAGADRDVGLARHPMAAAHVAAVERVERTGPAGQHPVGIEGRPAGAPRDAPLVADPAAAGASVTEDHGLRLEAEHGGEVEIPVVDLPLAVGALAAGAVEPLFEDLAVVAQRALERAAEDVVVGVGAVGRIVAVPRRNVDAEPEARFAAGVGEFAQHVALAVAPSAAGDGVVAGRIGPEAEAVVVFGRDDDPLHAGVARDRGPLAAVEVGGAKTSGCSRPSPHSALVKVLGPKWTNMLVSMRCHASCSGVGRAP